jgi:hypothetical protein
MITFQETLEQHGIEFVDALMNNYVVVYEKKDCSVLSFMRYGEELKFFKGNDKEEITPLNYALHNYFEEGINYIRRASSIFFREFPDGWLFKLNYKPTTDSDVTGVNPDSTDDMLELSAIVSDSGNVMKEESALSGWAERLGVGYVKPVFSGFLNEFQKSRLYAYIKEPVLSGDVTFSSYIMNILNPNVQSDSADGYYFNFYKNGSKKATALKLIDPMVAAFARKAKDSNIKSSNTSELVLLNFTCWLKNVDLSKYKVEGNTDDERYLDLICKLFNDYIEAESTIYSTYIKESYSAINLDRIKNEKTRELLSKHSQYQEPFQIIAGSFKSPKDTNYVNPTSLMNSDIVDSFNGEVERIMKKVSVEGITPNGLDGGKKPSEVHKPKEEEKFLTFIDFITQDKDSDYVKSMEQAKEKDEAPKHEIPKYEPKPDEKKDEAKPEAKKADDKKSGKDEKPEEKKKSDKEEKSDKDEKSSKDDKKSDEKANEKSDKEADKEDKDGKKDDKKANEKSDKDEKPEDKDEEKKSDEKADEEDNTDEKDNGEEKTDEGSEADNSDDGGDSDSASDNGGSDEGASDGGEETPKNDKKNGKKKDEKDDDGGSSFSL